MARVEEEKRSVVDLGDVNHIVSSSDFSYYMAANLQISEQRSNNFNVFWNEEYDESVGLGPQALLSTCSQSGLTLKEKIKNALHRFDFSKFEYILAQFWAPVKVEGRYILTTSDQPFGMSYLWKGLCRYRKICANSNYGAEGESRGNILLSGPPLRVFLNGLPEYSPNIQFYSTQEYPLRHDADRCKIRHYLALPVFERHSQNCVGVLELVARSESDEMLEQLKHVTMKRLLSSIQQISTELKGAELRTFENISAGVLRGGEFRPGLCEVTRTYRLPFAQIWTPISDSSSTKEAMFKAIGSFFGATSGNTVVLKEACNTFELIRWKGVVWRAFSSRGPCYCGDITQLRITEYPFAHIAEVLGLRRSIAICLQRNYSKDNYVIEFFLPEHKNRDPQTWLDLLVLTMKGYLKSFKFASGQELGMGLKLEVIGSSVEEKLDPFPIRHPQVKEISFGQEQDDTMLVENISEEQFRAEPEASSSSVLRAQPESFSHVTHDISNQGLSWEASSHLFCSPDLALHFDGTDIPNVQCTSGSYPGSGADVSSVQSFDGTSNGSNIVDEENVSAPRRYCRDIEEFLIMGDYGFGGTFSDLDLEDTFDVQPGKEGMQGESESKEINRQVLEQMFGLEPVDDVGNWKSFVDLDDTSDVQPGKEVMQAESESKEINRQVLEQHFGLKREDAALILGVSESTLKRKCREYGIPRWPYYKRKPATSSSSQSHNETQTSSYGQEGLHPNPSSTAGRSASPSAQCFLQAATVANRGMMTLKAEYGKKVIRFDLPLSSEMKDLEKEIATRLKLEVGKFDISYLDEDDEWILLTCDADLRIVESMGKVKIRLSISNS